LKVDTGISVFLQAPGLTGEIFAQSSVRDSVVIEVARMYAFGLN
jgi:hypothetical protein